MDPSPPTYSTPRSSTAPSWPLLLTLTAVIFSTAALMARNVWYTGGETIEFLYMAATGLTLLCSLVGFHSRLLATWLVLLIGGGLILGHAYQTRRWGILQEEIMQILDHARREKAKTGGYPPNLDGYTYRHPDTRRYIHYRFHEGKLMVSYALEYSAGNGFWYHEDGGFSYHGD